MTRIQTITEVQVFQIFSEEEKKVVQGSAQLSNSYPAIKTLLLCEELSDQHKETLKASHRRFKNAKSKFMKKGGYTAVVASANKQVLLENEVVVVADDEKPPTKKKPCKLKGLDELSRKQLKRRTDDVFAAVQNLATAENVSVARVLGFLLTRSPESEKIRQVGEMIWNEGSPNNLSNSNTVPEESALLLYNECKLGRQTYTKMRKLLTNAGFGILPAWRHLRVKQDEITPTSNPLPEPYAGVYYSLKESVRVTIKRLLPLTLQHTLSQNLVLNIKFGFDGSGSHSIYNQPDNEQTNNIIMTMFCPLDIQNDAGVSAWTQPSPNSPFTQRPVCLQLGKESEELLQSLKIFNPDIATMKEEGIVVESAEGAHNVKVNIRSHMMDMKAAHLYLGLGGAYCDLCTCSKEQCIDVERITGGFTINRTVADLQNIFNDIGLEDGTVHKSKGDYETRTGLTAQPIPTNETQSVQVLHALLRSFDFVMKICVHIIAGVYDWSESKTSRNNRFLIAAKEQLQQHIFNGTGQSWDKPDSTGKGGTSTTGNTARVLLYRRENRDLIISNLPEQHRETLRKVMLMFSVICRVMSSKREVNIDAYKSYCTELYLVLINDFPRQFHRHLPGPWISITPSVHKLLGHSWELMQNNDSHGLGSLDESGLEGCNKILRSIRTNLSRKVSQTLNLVDTLDRMWTSSDPLLNAERQNTLPFCSFCKERGHNIRYCVHKNVVSSAATEEDHLVSFLTNSCSEN